MTMNETMLLEEVLYIYSYECSIFPSNHTIVCMIQHSFGETEFCWVSTPYTLAEEADEEKFQNGKVTHQPRQDTQAVRKVKTSNKIWEARHFLLQEWDWEIKQVDKLRKALTSAAGDEPMGIKNIMANWWLKIPDKDHSGYFWRYKDSHWGLLLLFSFHIFCIFYF